MGRPERLELVEVGPGEGSFASGLLRALEPPLGDAVGLRLVEPRAALRARQRDALAGCRRVSWSATLAEVPPAPHTCLFANELLDNLPVHLVTTRAGALAELWVDAREELELVPGEPSTPALEEHLARLGIDLPEGHRFEVGLAATSFAAAAAETVRTGAVVLIDYGREAADLAARASGTLASYSPRGAGDDVLARPGSADVTAHVDWTSVRLALRDGGLTTIGPLDQASFLRGLGAAQLDAAAKEEHERALRCGDGTGAIRALSRRQAIGALTDPGGLGGLGVMVGLRGLEPRAVLPRYLLDIPR